MKTIIANWKMYPTYSDAMVLSSSLQSSLEEIRGVECVIAPPIAWLLPIVENWKTKHPHIHFAAQNIFAEDQGAYTGEMSAYMLRNIIKYAIIGHSERRRHLGEDNEMIREKVVACLKWRITPIFCVGEAKKALKDDKLDPYEWEKLTDQLVEGLSGLSPHQLEEVIVAYEPVWAISANSSSKAADPNYASEIISRLRKKLSDKFSSASASRVRFVYGGSVTPSNASEYLLQPEISGLLVGSVSVKAKDFLNICRVASVRR
jgi:triosephosphate isomerase